MSPVLQHLPPDCSGSQRCPHAEHHAHSQTIHDQMQHHLSTGNTHIDEILASQLNSFTMRSMSFTTRDTLWRHRNKHENWEQHCLPRSLLAMSLMILMSFSLLNASNVATKLMLSRVLTSAWNTNKAKFTTQNKLICKKSTNHFESIVAYS